MRGQSGKAKGAKKSPSVSGSATEEGENSEEKESKSPQKSPEEVTQPLAGEEAATVATAETAKPAEGEGDSGKKMAEVNYFEKVSRTGLLSLRSPIQFPL